MPFCGTCTLADVLRDIDRHTLEGTRTGETLRSTIANHQNDTVVAALKQQHHISPGEVLPPLAAIAESGKTKPQPGSDERAHIENCLLLISEIAAGLDHAHQRGIVHCDLKPANILIADDGRPMILDFNLSRDLGATNSARGIGGTLPYMAPEHLQSFHQERGEVQPTGDVFAVGVILFELLTGERPFPDRDGEFETIVDDMISDRFRPALSARGINPRIPVSVDSILHKCLSGRVEQRYSSASQLREDIHRELTHRPLRHAANRSLPERLSKWCRRHPKLTSASFVGVLAVVLVAMLAMVAWQARLRWRRTEAEQQFAAFQHELPRVKSLLGTAGLHESAFEQGWQAASDWARAYAPVKPNSTRPFADLLTAQQNEILRAELGSLLRLMVGAQQHRTDATGDGLTGEELLRAAEQLTADTPGPAASTARDYLALGTELLQQRQFDGALESLQHAVRLSPRDYAARCLLGNAYAGLGRFAEAEDCFDMCVALREDIAWGYFQRGWARLMLRDYQGARSDCDRYLETRPDDRSGLRNRSLAFQGLGDWKSALHDLDQIVDIGTAQPRVFFLRGQVRGKLGDAQGAQSDFERGISILPADEANWLARAAAFLRAGDVDAAQADLVQAVKQFPWSAAASRNLAYLLSEHKHRTNDAERVLSQAIESHPSDAELISSRGVLRARLGQTHNARKDVTSALLISQNAPILVRAASVFALTGSGPDDTKQALEYLRRAFVANPHWSTKTSHDPDFVRLVGDAEFDELLRAAQTLVGKENQQ